MGTEIYHGKFQYAGGHPDAAKASSAWARSQVKVTHEGLEFFHGKDLQFVISKADIRSVKHETGAVGGLGGNNDQFVVVEMARGGRSFAVLFKALGMTQQKDSFALNAALSSIAGDVTSPASEDGRLNSLEDLFAKGLITQAEFDVKKSGTAAPAPASMGTNLNPSKEDEQTPRTSPPDPLDQIAKLAQLHASGVLTDEEFTAKKAELLTRL